MELRVTERERERERGRDDVFLSHLQVMVGDSGVGKSCLLEKLLDSTSNNHFISTIGVDVRSLSVAHNGETYKLQVMRNQRHRNDNFQLLSVCETVLSLSLSAILTCLYVRVQY